MTEEGEGGSPLRRSTPNPARRSTTPWQMDGYDNAKARRPGGMLKRLIVLRARTPGLYPVLLTAGLLLVTASVLWVSGGGRSGAGSAEFKTLLAPLHSKASGGVHSGAGGGRAEGRRGLEAKSRGSESAGEGAGTTVQGATTTRLRANDTLQEGLSSTSSGSGADDVHKKSADLGREKATTAGVGGRKDAPGQDWHPEQEKQAREELKFEVVAQSQGQASLVRGGVASQESLGAKKGGLGAEALAGAEGHGDELSAQRGRGQQEAAGQEWHQQTRQEQEQWRERQQKVARAFQHAWKGYRAYAFGFDELAPESKQGANGLGGLGATIVDALDTAMLMGHGDIVREAGEWVAHELPKRIGNAGQVNLFETTIRVMGGLLTAFHLRNGSVALRQHQQQRRQQQHATPNKDLLLQVAVRDAATYSLIPDAGPPADAYLAVAKDLGERLLTAFTMSPTPVALSDVFLHERRAQRAGFGGASSTAECTTVQMEFWELSRLTGDPSFGDAAMKVMEHVRDLPKSDGLVPIYIEPDTGSFSGQDIRLGSRGDSYYEYLVKVWLQQGRQPAYLRRMFDEAMEGVRKWLVAESKPRGLIFVGERPYGVGGALHPKMDHLVCFLPGALVLGATGGLPLRRAQKAGLVSANAQYYLDLAKNLTHACYEMYNVTATGLAPEIAYFNMDGSETRDGTTESSWFGMDIEIHMADRHNLLRPETVEALFYMHRVTGAPQYREWGWRIFEAFEQFTRVGSGGYTSLHDVTTIPPPRRDKMETFFLGETLKYFYLLFGEDNVLPLHRFVFNTEAHPLPIVPRPQTSQGEGIVAK